MHVPPDHPLRADPVLWERVRDAAMPVAGVVLGTVLRTLPGRRMAIAVRSERGAAVLKVYANPRARGNHRRLQLIGRELGDGTVPASLGADASGHVGLVAWQPGTELAVLRGERFVGACRAAGAALVRLHDTPVRLDRSWGVADELRQLEAGRVEPTREAVAAIRAEATRLTGAPAVCAHRDFHPRQVVADAGVARIIDLDDAANAPAGLDVGNFLAHLAADALTGARPPAEIAAARAAFVDGYGRPDPATALWERLALLRLAGLAATRHGRPEDSRRILAGAVAA